MNIKSMMQSASSNGMANATGENLLSAGTDKLLADLSAVADDARAIAISASELSAQRIATVPIYLERRLGIVQDRLYQIGKAIEAQSKQVTKATDDYVSANPWKSMGLFSIAGIAVGYLLFGGGRSVKSANHTEAT
jgi:ElaB/YqjD/DUF883 family membrane-anchored ribosome-binding protein